MSRRAVAIIMYHKVGGPVTAKGDTFLNVPTDRFVRQMDLLSRLGYRGVTMSETVEGLAGRLRLPRRSVCVTFDDGFGCVSDYALSPLEKLGWPATLFVASGWMGSRYTHFGRPGDESDRVMEATAIKALLHTGWELGGHTRTHARLADLDDAAAMAEIRLGSADLAEAVGVSPRTFCYPGGSYNERTPALLRTAGLIGACTTRSGLARSTTDPFLLPRVKPASRDGLATFLYRLLIRPYLP
jgi:peptidoglycan/xylan/chitin deacetylase (PgdA/CDA1 family)